MKLTNPLKGHHRRPNNSRHPENPHQGVEARTSYFNAMTGYSLGEVNVSRKGPPDPFNGFFPAGQNRAVDCAGLLDIGPARHWFKLLNWGIENDLYTYQQALEGHSGPHVLVNGQSLLMMSSYDYLGLIGHPAIEAAAVEATRIYGTGTGGVRLLTGTTDLHRKLEHGLAVFKGTEASLVFSSGYMANVGIISALLGPRDRVIVDSLAHRSIVDGCTLARVPFQSFCHNDLSTLRHALETKPFGKRTLIVVEGIYSMDGDICPLPDLVELKNRYGAFLMVDEAHSFGVLGPTGRGVDEHFGLTPDHVDIWTGSLSKAIPSNGGYLTGSKDLVIYLQHGAATFMFSAALCPSAVAAAHEALRVFKAEPLLLTKVHHNAQQLREGLRELGYNIGKSTTPIVPVMLGDDISALVLARRLYDLGVFVTPVVYPAVPHGGARLRLCATASHSKRDLQEVFDAFRKVRSIV